MRLPNDSQLSREQKEVCFAPTEQTILVKGPPGSGKTVIAIFRQNALRRQKKSVATVVYNHVLRRYTGIDQTFYSWLGNWWRMCTRHSFPYAHVAVGEGEKTRRVYDYEQAAQLAIAEFKEAIVLKGHWGHLILDEAQDFNKKAHMFLFAIRNFVFGGGGKQSAPAMTILADENQRLNAENSSIQEIKSAHLLSDGDVYDLRRNYRNTRQIAAFAAQFYVGLPTGIPELPARNGDKPRIILTHDINDATTRIFNYARLHENEEIGVLVYYDNTRRSLANKLKHRLQHSSISVQTYSSKEGTDVDELDFDEGGRVTVLCFASAKGLEFDAVFIAELQAMPIRDDQILTAKMNLYVMSSRARERLFLMVSDTERQHSIWKLLSLDRSCAELEEIPSQ